MMTALLMSFLMGLTGSLHCAGMCGPIMWVMPFQSLQGGKKLAGVLLYHLSRITVYVLLALVLYSFRSFFHPQWQQYVSVALGGLLLLMGVFYFLPNSALRVKLPWTKWVQHKLGAIIGNPKLSTLAAAGFLNGLLPCGLVYMALSAALTAQTAANAAALIFVFGLGTMPMLLTLIFLRNRFTALRNLSLRKMVPVLMFVFGSLFVLRGMNLGIPYLSPKVVVEHQQIKSCCCHH
ncbi:sulfite exporter TauE/SafE family protein [Taibaiella soli]|uniref:Sulfite exporter TauE/SafE family protein n=1 Tax=Taibaiella soli TaxID=1649169 RepID=A0A2W2BCF5_9BACT|nr:sulfite exporter TauE/SafE family protein [Taibaiella soli]PZF71346.1 sulfite exporter TauE/SafE family protein [Taibaiella soli]